MASSINIIGNVSPRSITTSARNGIVWGELYINSATYNPNTHKITGTVKIYMHHTGSDWHSIDGMGAGIDTYDTWLGYTRNDGEQWHTGSFDEPWLISTENYEISGVYGSISKVFGIKFMSGSGVFWSDRWYNGSYCYEGSSWVYFGIPEYTITANVASSGGGRVSGGAKYSYGSTATLTATPNNGYHFVRWSSGSTSSTINVTVTANATYTATFAPDTYTVAYNVNAPAGASGTIPSAPASQTKTFNQTLSLQPAINGLTMSPPYNFMGWKDVNTNQIYAGSAAYNANTGTTMYAQWSIAYLKPTITTEPIPTVYRCNSSGVSKDDGTRVFISIQGTYDSIFITGSGTVTARLRYKESGSSGSFSTAALTNSQCTLNSGTYTLSTYTTSAVTFNPNVAYIIEITVQDSSGQTYSTSDPFTTFLSTSFFPMDFTEDGKSCAVGMAAPNVPQGSNGLFQVEGGYKANLPSDLNIWNSSQNVYESLRSVFLNAVYPVGAIYISTSSTDPSTLFGGQWQQIKDRFLLAAGDDYDAGETGGEEEVTLSINEMPRHYHVSADWGGNNEYFGVNSGGAGTYRMQYTVASSQRLESGYTGGSQPHNNMPPYLAVYCWKRVQ